MKHGQEGMDIEVTMFTTVTVAMITGPKGDHHMPRKQEQQTFMCDGQLGSREKARAYGPKAEGSG